MGKQTFGIALSKGVYVAGEKLTGSLYVDFPQETKGSSVILEFLGKEETLVKYTYEESTSVEYNTPSARTKDAISSRNLIQVNLPVSRTNLIRTNGTIAAGKYNLPFSIDLPTILPSSMRENYHDGSYCQILYTLKAEIKGSGFFSNYKDTQTIEIVQPPLPTSSALAYTVPPSTEAVNMLCCINQGTVSVSAKMDDTKLNRGETTKVSVGVRNHSSTSVSGIYAELHQICQWEAEHRKLVNNSKLVVVEFKDLNKILADNQDAGKSLPQVLLNEVERGAHAVQLTAPNNALPTYTGTLVNVTHHVEIVVKTGSCIDDPTVSIPVQIGGAKKAGSSVNNSPPASSLPSDFVVDTEIDIPEANDASIIAGTKLDDGVPKTTDGLLKAMEASIQDLNLIQDCTADSGWQSYFGSLSPNEYGNIIKAVSSDFEQPAVAELLARHVNDFTCQHAVAALRTTAEWSRGSTLDKLLPYIKDIQQNHQVIRQELSEWELMVAQSKLDEATK